MDTNTAGIGHNKAPSPLEDVLDPEIIQAQMEIDHAATFARRTALEGAYDRLQKLLQDGPRDPKNVKIPLIDDALAAKASDLASQLKKHGALMEKTRTVVKAPFAAAVTAIDRLWKTNGSDIMQARGQSIEREILSPYLTRKAAEERRVAQEAAETLRAEVERARAEAAAALEVAERTMHPDLIDNASAADVAADVAQLAANSAERRAHGSLADMSRTRGAGSMVSLREHWSYRVVDFDKVPHDCMELSAQRINAKIKAGERNIPGLEIYEDNKAQVR